MNARRSGRIPVGDRSALSSVRGLPAWTAVLLAVAVALTGVAIDARSGELGTTFTIAFFVGCLLSVLAVARRSVFVAGVQPPILLATMVPLVYAITNLGGSSGGVSRTQLISVALPLITRFPLMVTTTLVVVSVALLRAFVLEPGSTRAPRTRGPGQAPAHARR